MADGTTDGTIKVLIADDHPVVREGLRSFLTGRPGITVVGEAGDTGSAVAAARVQQPDVALVDLMMPGNGLEAIRELRALPSPPRVLVLTSFAGDDKVLPALRAGAAGYLLKDLHPADLEAAIRTVHQGGALLGSAVAARVLDQATARRPDGSPDDDRVTRLTPREREVLALLARGLTNRQLADQLYVSEKTIKTHVSSILTKLHVADRTQAALFAVRLGLTGEDED
ncbi:MAG: response regulator [Acidimicrobiales bacterium]